MNDDSVKKLINATNDFNIHVKEYLNSSIDPDHNELIIWKETLLSLMGVINAINDDYDIGRSANTKHGIIIDIKYSISRINKILGIEEEAEYHTIRPRPGGSKRRTYRKYKRVKKHSRKNKRPRLR